MSIVDWIGGTIDTTTSVCHGLRHGLQSVGEVTCTLGVGGQPRRLDHVLGLETWPKVTPGTSPSTA
ncbi:MAG: hypothetical protein U0836_10555 [Pirellulales bacterium]